jgi:glycosyltransferase involved in cell wall biosynthesis
LTLSKNKPENLSDVGISVVIPYFNGSAFIKEAILSVNGSLGPNDEIIVVDDGSKESELNYLLEVLKELNSPVIRLIKHESNRGGGAARNSGVRNSAKNWIFNLDADNVLPSGLIHQLLEFAIAEKVDVACPATIHFFRNEISQITHDWVFTGRQIEFQDHLSSPYVPSASGNYLFSKIAYERAGGFPEFGYLDTWGFGLRMVAAGSKMRSCPSTFYFHRFGHESYYIRGSKNPKNTTLWATSLILENSDKLDSKLIQSLMSRKHRYTWFSLLQNNPFKIKGRPSGEVRNR